MSGFLRFLVSSTVSLGVCAFVFASDAATGRGDYTNVRQDVGGTGAGKSASGATGRNGTAPTVNRMPSMPTLPVSVIGNISTNVPKPGTNVPSGPNTPDNPDVPDDSNPETPDEQESICQDAYTVENCMNGLTACIDGGALPNGLKDMFNNDLRTSIINGMNLCAVQVDKCITDTTLNCNKVYFSRADVWIDFNSRRVQPEYYSFVLSKTGLTPTQAENTCLLLDSNTYGSSFNRVKSAVKDAVKKEDGTLVDPYNNKKDPTKDNPLGEKENDTFDRGHYARWDAVEGECLIRVAAYNKDKLITNDSLFGAIGDGSPAESWQVAGSAFTCNKDLFDFGLMRNTRTAAAIALPGGAVLGAGTGAVVGGVRAKNGNCTNKDFRDELWGKIRNKNLGTINTFLGKNGYTGDLKSSLTTLTKDQCNAVLVLYDKMQAASDLVKACYGYLRAPVVGESNSYTITLYDTNYTVKVESKGLNVYDNNNSLVCSVDFDRHVTTCSDKVVVEFSDIFDDNSLFQSECANLATLKSKTGFECPDKTCDDCIDFFWFAAQAGQLRDALDGVIPGEGKNPSAAKGALVGGAVGLGAGGIATGIVALIEASNIHCVVGDGLGNVQYKKSYAIDSLKDLYVKHKLNLPDTKLTGASTMIKDQTQWKNQCASYEDEDSCNDAQFYYQYSTTGKSGAYSTEWIYSACQWDGTSCGAKEVLFNSYGVPQGS